MSYLAEAAEAANDLIRTVNNTSATMTIVTDRSSVTIGNRPDAEPATGPIMSHPTERASVPPDTHFDEDDFFESTGLDGIGQALIRHYPEFAPLQRHSVNVRFVWKRKGGQSGGKDVYGKCQKASGLVKFFGDCDFVIWIAADHVRESAFTNLQLEALLYHQIRHCDYEIDEKTGEIKLAVTGHDDELFCGELRRYGSWRESLRRTGDVYAQVGLPAEGGVS